MSNKIVLKKSSVVAKVPLTTDIDYGELAINYADGKLYYKTSAPAIDYIPSATATATLTNKTLTSPTINGGALSGTFSGVLSLSDTTASTSTTTGAVKIAGGLGVAGTVYADKMVVTNNGGGSNIQIGDDVWLGDVNQSNTLGIRGSQDASKGYIIFGNANNTAYIGRDGSNPIQVTGQFKVDSGTVTGTNAIALQIAGYANKGGTGYHDFLSVTNGYATATNPNKFFRLSSDGQFQIINSAYTTNIFNLTDAGTLSVPQISAGGSTGTSGQVLQSTGTGMQWATIAGSGTVTSIVAGTGLTGGTITTTGTIALADSGVTAGTYTKVTVDVKGRVTTGASLLAADIPSLSSTYLPLTGGTLSGELSFNDDGEGITFYGSGRIYKKAGTGLIIRRHSADIDPQVENNAGTSSWTILHAGNYSSYALPLTGGSLTGVLNTSADIQQNNATYLKGKLAAGTATRLFGLNASNTLYIGSIDADHTGGTLFVKNGVSQMVLDASGNLGIGTTSPTQKLHVTGTGYATTDFRAPIFYDSDNTTYFADLANSGTAILTNGNVAIDAGDGKGFRFWNSDNYKIWMSSAGAASVGGRIAGDTTSDYNMYFRMAGGGTNRGYVFETDNANKIFAINPNGVRSNVGVTIAGALQATTKSFLIDHPTKPGKKLLHGSLEGPEHGVYVRGKVKGNVIELPEYWTKLVDPDSITVQLTAIGKGQKLYVEDIRDNKVYIGNDGVFAAEPNCFYLINAERIDIDKLIEEVD
jgi:hypothetical protein